MFEAGRPVCIVNPASARGRTATRWPRMRYDLERLVGPIDCLLTGGPGEATELARDAASKGATLIIAVGGDGTASEIVNGLMQVAERPADLALGLVPAGTGGDLARSLGIPHGEAALKILAEGRRRPLDVGRVDFSGEGRNPALRYFVNVASLGIEALVDRNIRSVPRLLGGRVAYLWSALAATVRYRPARVVLRSGTLELRRTIFNAAVANGRFFGGGMEIAPSARLDDGRLELVLVRNAPLWRLALGARHLYNGTAYQAPGVEHFSLTSLEAASEDGSQVLLGIDGEPLGELPARFSIEPAALQVIAGA